MAVQLREPNLATVDGLGWCLRFTQTVYGMTGAPFWHPSAWAAWKATEHKHTSRALPNVSVPVWFSHYGTYGDPPTYDNWGHVVAWVPGRGFLSSPAWLRIGETVGQQWFSTIAQVEAAFGAKFVGWSTDLNGQQIADLAQGGAGSGSTEEQEEAELMAIKDELFARIEREARRAALPQIVLTNKGHELVTQHGTVGIWGDDIKALRSALVALDWQRRPGSTNKAGKDDGKLPNAYARGGPGSHDLSIYRMYLQAAANNKPVQDPKTRK